MNAGLPLHFLLLIKRNTNGFFFNAYYNTTEGNKHWFEQTSYMIYCSIQNVLAIDLKGRKIEDQVNQIVSFYQGYLDLIKCYRKRFFAY